MRERKLPSVVTTTLLLDGELLVGRYIEGYQRAPLKATNEHHTCVMDSAGGLCVLEAKLRVMGVCNTQARIYQNVRQRIYTSLPQSLVLSLSLVLSVSLVLSLTRPLVVSLLFDSLSLSLALLHSFSFTRSPSLVLTPSLAVSLARTFSLSLSFPYSLSLSSLLVVSLTCSSAPPVSREGSPLSLFLSHTSLGITLDFLTR